MSARRLIAALTAIGTLVYPVLVYVGLTRWSARHVGAVIAAFVVLSLALRLRGREEGRSLLILASVPVLVIGLAALSAALDSATFVLFVPVFISAGLLFTFGITLRAGSTPMIESFARLTLSKRESEPPLSVEELRWCRQITILWCGFFALNGLTALVLAVAAPLSWWAIYSGGIAYGLIGVLALGEFLVRKWRFQRFDSSAIDRLLSRMLLAERQP